MMSHSADEAHLEPYRKAVDLFGPGFKATLWGSREAQLIRFDVMIDYADFADCAVLDIGCGPGDFAQHLIEREVPFARYVGIDAMPEVIESARQRELPGCTFEVRNVMSDFSALQHVQPDYATISGTLNTMDQGAARELVSAAFDAAAQGVVFNFLSDRPGAEWTDRDLGPARRFNTVAWLDWALSITPRVSFTQEYLDGHDATVMMRH